MEKNLAEELRIVNKKLVIKNQEQEKQIKELALANEELVLQNKEKERRSSGLTDLMDKLNKAEIRLSKANGLYSFISHINRTITRVKDEQTLFNEVCRIAVEIGHFKMAWIGIADISNRKINLVASSGATEEDIKLLSDKTYHVDGLTDTILHGEEYYTIPNIQEEDIIKWKDYAAARGFISAVSLPIKKSGKVIGTFDLYASETNLFSDKEINMLKEVAEDISFAVDLFEKEKIHQNTLKLVSENEMRFRALIENSLDMITLTDKNGKITYCSPSIKKLLGYSLEELLHIYPQSLIHPDELPDYLEKRDYVLQRPGQPFHFRQRRLHKNGNWVWCEGSTTNMLDEQAVGAMVSNFRDITEKVIAEQQHEFDKNNLDALINNTADLMWSVDRDFNLITSNIPFDGIIKISFGEINLEGSSIFSIPYTPEKQSRFKKQYERAFAGEYFVVTEHFNFPVEGWAEISFYPIRKGDEVIGAACHSRDITNIKKAEYELQRALSDLTKIMDSSLDVICAVDAEGNFLKVSAASEAVWGYKPEELIGKPLINLVYHKDKAKTLITAGDLMEGNDLSHFENRYVRKDGSLVPIEWSARWDEKDQVRYGVARDVTEKKRLEKAFEVERLQFFDLFSEAPSSMGVLNGPTHIFVMANPPYLQLIGKKDIIGKPVIDVLPEVVEQGFIEILDRVYQTGNAYSANEMLIKLDINNNGELVDRYLNFLYQPHRGNDGNIDGIFFFAVDVSEQVLSRKQIEESEARLNEAQALSHISNWGIDLATGVHTWSDEFYHICGIKPGDTEPSAEAFFSFIHPEDTAYVKDTMQIDFETFASSKFYSRILTKDGSIKYVYSEWKFEFDESDKPLRLYGILQDITERTLIEEKVLESESKLKAAQAISGIGSWELDFETSVMTLSDEGARLFGLPAHQHKLSSEDWAGFIHPDDKEMIENKIEKSINKVSVLPYDHRIVLKDGTIKYIHSESKFLFDSDGKPTGMNGTVQDVTESTKAAENLKQSESRFREFFELAPESIVVIDTSTMTFAKFNENALKLLKYSAKEFTTKGLADISPPFQPDGQATEEKARELLMKAVNGEKLVFEWMLIDKDGKEIISEVRFALIFNNDGPQVIANFADISQRKESEKGLATITSDLLQRNKDLEQFAYIVSHNLRAPVANIMGLSEVLRTVSMEDFEKEEIMEGISTSVIKLNDVILDLNDILQVKNNLSEKREIVSFSSLVKNIQISISDQIKKQEVLIKTDFSAIDKMLTLQSYLYSIFYNLISNSIKFRQPGLSPVIEIKSYVLNDKIELHYQDNGLGIDMKKKGDQIFGLYKRFHEDTEGRGVGLFMTKTQVETLGGKITMESEVNKGTAFIIQFPI